MKYILSIPYTLPFQNISSRSDVKHKSGAKSTKKKQFELFCFKI